MSDAPFTQAFERLKAQYPKDEVGLKMEDRGFGTEFVAIVGPPMDLVCDFGKTPGDTVDRLIAKAGNRDPESIRQKKIAELQERIDTLKAVAA